MRPRITTNIKKPAQLVISVHPDSKLFISTTKNKIKRP
jgi:hypothetical protein